MSRIAYVNGRYLRHRQATVHVEDRGYQFADAVYEVIAVRRGRLVDRDGHLERLRRSLGELRIAWPISPGAVKVVIDEVVRRNRLVDGIVYLQVSRGVAPRGHAFPKGTASALVVTARGDPPLEMRTADRGVAVITIPDERWKRCDIKTISLLPNVLGKQKAEESEAFEAWMVDAQGMITEGTSSNAWIVTAEGELVTRHADHAILNGITRRAVLALARREGLALAERPFTVAEAMAAREAFLTSTTSSVKPVVRIDGANIGDGAPGRFTGKLMALYAAHMDGPGGDG